MKSTWANEQQIGVIVIIDGFDTYLDSGPQYDAAVAAGPAPYAGPSNTIDLTVTVLDQPKATIAVIAERLGLDATSLEALFNPTQP
ncbi:MAG: hypothetical protein WCO04_14975 [Pseudomonadota bacterium]